MPLDILLVEDEPTLLLTLGDALEDAGHSVTRSARGDEASRLLGERGFDLLVTDIRLPSSDGHTLARQALATRPRTEVILMTAFADVEQAVALMRAGATDYLCKPFHEDTLLARVREIEERLVPALREGAEPVAESPAMRALLRLARRVARADVPVVLTGETGVGKEVIARFLHACSTRAAGPFLPANCAAIPAELVESELFGHERGAFTGASQSRQGWMRAANGGTLFLDEVGELSLDAQARLLRALETGTFMPVGADRAVTVNLRLIAATNRDLHAAAESGRFRKDLLYRLETFELAIPPLRGRPEDIVPLARHFAARAPTDGEGPLTLSAATRSLLVAHAWPGNVRELKNAVEHAAVLAGSGAIEPEHLPPRVRAVASGGDPMDLRAALRRAEDEQVRRALAATEGRKAEAADLLGISRKHLWELIRRGEGE